MKRISRHIEAIARPMLPPFDAVSAGLFRRLGHAAPAGTKLGDCAVAVLTNARCHGPLRFGAEMIGEAAIGAQSAISKTLQPIFAMSAIAGGKIDAAR